MKSKILILLTFVFISFITFAQNNDAEIKALKSKIAKSDAEITNPKKSAKVTTWTKRGGLFLEAYKVNTKLLAPGLDALTLSFIGKSESDPTPFYGEPLEKKIEGEYEVWVYKRIKVFISEGFVSHWEETEISFPGALGKAYEAYTKAIELDVEKKYITKNSTVNEIKELRDNLMNESIEKFYAEDYSMALTDLEKCFELIKYKAEDDTVDVGAMAYFAGIFAYNAQKPDKAVEYFQLSIDNGYEIGTSYQYLAQVLYEKNDSTAALKKLEEGVEKYPQESKIIYSLIDYYTPRGEYEKAFEYIDKAISLTPDNSILYIVKGNSYAKIYDDFEQKYFKLVKTADSLDKEAFKNRNEPAKQKPILEEKSNVLNSQLPPVEQKMNEYFDKTLEAYNNGIEYDNKKADYYYTVSYFYYQTVLNYQKYSSGITKLKDITTKLDEKANDYILKSKEYGEKALELNPQDIYTMEILSKVYYRLQMYDESEEMKKKIEELEK